MQRSQHIAVGTHEDGLVAHMQAEAVQKALDFRCHPRDAERCPAKPQIGWQ